MTARPWLAGWDGLLCWRTLPTSPRSQVTLLVLTLDLHVRAMEIQCCKHRLWRSSETHRTVVTYVTFVLVAGDCRPINIVEDGGLTEVIRIASGDNSYGLPSKGTTLSLLYF